MRAALPHLRLLTLPMDKLYQLSKFLSPEERSFLAVRLLFQESAASPPSLNTNASPREKFVSNKVWEVIPERLILTDHLEMTGKGLARCERAKEMFSVDLNFLLETICLKGIEILTQANNYPEFKQTANNSDRCEIFLFNFKKL